MRRVVDHDGDLGPERVGGRVQQRVGHAGVGQVDGEPRGLGRAERAQLVGQRVAVVGRGGHLERERDRVAAHGQLPARGAPDAPRVVRAGDQGDAHRRSPPVAVRDRHPAVAAERLAGDLDAGRLLAALVLGQVDEPDDAVDVLGRQAARDELLAAEVLLDVALEDRVEDRVGRQRVLVLLVGAQLGRRRAVRTSGGTSPPPARASRALASRKTRVLGTSLMTANPPALSP